ncbi:hypothetical protein TKK_0016832 [Trichogramma kaykai]|uniref:DNA replication ATP-dependent helicase/nuclease n=1 Tax=Trichogramma kaykai TaxID=54128 RepID=A0ABD2W556_9HYME
MNKGNQNVKNAVSPTKQRTPLQVRGQKKLSLYFSQNANIIKQSSAIIESSGSDSDEEREDIFVDCDSQKKRKRRSDPMSKNVRKIQKTFDGNISFASDDKNSGETEFFDSMNKELELNTAFVSGIKSTDKFTAIKEESVQQFDELLNNSKNDKNDDKLDSASIISATKDSGIETQGTNTLEVFDDFFEEEWSYDKNGKETENLDDLFQDEWSDDSKKILDFTIPQRCNIVDIVWDKTDMTLIVKGVKDELIATVKCFGLWRYTKVEPGEPVVIKAVKESPDAQYWTVNNNSGWIINQPDTLISGTSVVGALWCNRRSALQEKFKNMESLPYNEVGNHFMLTGSLTHELIQTVLDQNITELKKISDLLEKILKSKHAIDMMYAGGISYGECKNLMKPAVPQIYKFVQRYIIGTKPAAPDQNFDGKIDQICDIEENVWLPSLGLKGKIDLTVKVSYKSKNPLNPAVEQRILPLEIKTGKSSFSREHQGQLILYTMMMNMTGREVTSGLLLYLRENIMREIVGSFNAQRDLITLRNTVAYYLSREPIILKVNDEEVVQPMEFPKPINHPSCSKCPYNVLCCTYLTEDDKNDMSENHPLKTLSEQATSHLTKDHMNYVMKWISLLQIEEKSDNEEVTSWKDVWTLKPSKREKRGSCICNLSLISVTEKYERFLHTFERSKSYEKSSELNASDFGEQEYVIISTNDRINIVSGFIDDINGTTVSVHCEKNITKVYKNDIFHIDKSSSSSLLTQNMGQLGGLLDDQEICSKLRHIVIDKRPASFESDMPPLTMETGADIFEKLNENQKQAILKTLTADDYILIKGFPGTGKTQTLVSMIELLVRLGKSVLISAHTNSAIDNILLKLLERKIDFIRFGSVSKAHPAIQHLVDQNVTAHCDTPESLHTVYCSKQIVAVTCYGATHAHLSRRKFDYCIIDESTQVLQPTILRPLYCASKFVLVGDPEQLPPIARNSVARKLGINKSLFSRLDSDNNSVALTLQYRMNSCIMDVANKLTYHDLLKVGTEDIGKATLPVTKISDFETCEKWIQKALSMRLKNSAIMLNTSSTYQLVLDTTVSNKPGIRTCNLWEASIIYRLIDVLQDLGIHNKDIGVIAPYRAQVRFLRSLLLNSIEVNTVDQFQGRDKSVIIYGCTKSISPETDIAEFDILKDQQRLTVAVTRAKHKLIIIGDAGTLKRFSPFKKLLDYLGSHDRIYDLKDGQDDFSFDDLMKIHQ